MFHNLVFLAGCGEPNFDALHVNPFESKNQRREREVRQLLDKIQPELISLDTSEITRVNINALEEEHEKMKKLLYLNPRSISYQPKFKRRGRSGAMKREQRKQGMKAAMRFEMNEERKTAEDTLLKLQNVAREEGTKSVLDRFRRKDA
ncbi:hypothetical protein AB6A40_003414 [Gnathostoma spinigerum]|uniref:BING4 C-terminal domain-containing protein n=1 Tax=Gnathostoma spinigerum TaxID=75299 RepID=A0ABD6EAP3_9BILA